MKKSFCAFAAGLFFSVFTASAWNDTGHMLVAQLAWRALSQTERIKISTLLQSHPHFAELLNTNIPSNVPDRQEYIFMKAATWPDMVRPGTNKPPHITAFHRDIWHYINLPFVAPDDVGSVTPSPPKLTNAVERLGVLESDLRTASLPASDRAVALCWYLHITGDIHQPLHSVAWFSPEFNDQDGDRGGNEVAIQPKTSPKKLHTFWDELLGTGVSSVFLELLADDVQQTWPASKLKKELKHKAYMEWAEESEKTAIAFGYLDGTIPHAKWRNNITAAEVPDLDPGYEPNARMIARRRAAAAGIRLGQKLKAIF